MASARIQLCGRLAVELDGRWLEEGLSGAKGRLLFTYLVPRDWPALRSKWLQPVMKCGEEWLACFCIGVFLSFAGHFVLITGPNSVAMQILVSITGLVMMTTIAYYISWSRRQDLRPALRAEA